MSYWARHLILLILAIVAPVAAYLWSDSTREADRAANIVLEQAKQAASALSTYVELDIRHRVDSARELAQAIELERADTDWLTEQGRAKARRRRKGVELELEHLELVDKRLAESRHSNGFAWLIDAEGAILVGGGPASEAGPRSARGHPLFQLSQQGVAGDMLWKNGSEIIWAAAAPLVISGRARGAVVVGWPIDKAFLERLSKHISIDVSLVNKDKKVIFTSLKEPDSHKVVASSLLESSPVLGGELDTPLPSPVPGLPLFVGAKASGLAYASMAVPMQGSELKWVVSTSTRSELQELASRQIYMLLSGLGMLLLFFLFGVYNYRSYISPINIISEYLSNLHSQLPTQPRIEGELSERKVGAPFKRLVRLVNMTVQKLPSRSSPLSSVVGAFGSDSLSNISNTASLTEPTPSERPLSGVTPKSNEGDDGELAAIIASLAPSPEGVSPSIPQPEPDFSSAQVYSDGLSDFSSEPSGSTQDTSESQSSMGLAPDKMPSESLLQGLNTQATDDLMGGISARSADEIRGAMPSLGAIAQDESEGLESPSLPFGESSREASAGRGLSALNPVAGPSAGGGRQQSIRAGGSLDLSQGVGLEKQAGLRPLGESTIVSNPYDAALQMSEPSQLPQLDENKNQEMTVVATVDPSLLSKTVSPLDDDDMSVSRLDDEDLHHFRQVYENFLSLREQCGERTREISFDRFLTKLENNRAKLVEKYSCRTVRFQVYEKDGKAALRATPVRSGGGR